MSYYKARRNLVRYIITLIQNRSVIELNEIIFFGLKEFGFGKKSILNILEEIENAGFIQVKGNKIFSKIKENK